MGQGKYLDMAFCYIQILSFKLVDTSVRRTVIGLTKVVYRDI